MKQCSKCNLPKELGEFSRSATNKDGYKGACKPCTSNMALTWAKNNKERVKANKRAWIQANKEQEANNMRNSYSMNKEQRQAYKRTWTQANRDRVLGYRKSWKQANPHMNAYYSAKYRAAKLQRTPSWLTPEDWDRIDALYIEAQRLTKQTGISHHVDHIIPLQGETISGFHHPDNLQILTGSENSSKGNRHG